MEKTYDITQGSKGIQRVQASPIRAILDRAAVLRSEGNKVIPLSAGEPNFNTPAPIKEAVKKAIDENYSHYGSNRGLAKLRQILSEQNARETGVTYDPETEVFITSSGAEAINNAILAFVDKGDEGHYLHPGLCQLQESGKILWRRVCGSAPEKRGRLPDRSGGVGGSGDGKNENDHFE